MLLKVYPNFIVYLFRFLQKQEIANKLVLIILFSNL